MLRLVRFFSLLMVIVCCTTLALHAQDFVSLTLFVDEDSLTVYLSGSGSVSIAGLVLELSQTERYAMSDYAAFAPLRFTDLPAPLCLRLERDGTNRVLPTSCQSITTVEQVLVGGDVFWYDTTTAQFSTLLVMQGTVTQGICPAGQPGCDVNYIPPTPTPTPPEPPTPVLLPTSTPTVTLTLTPTPPFTATPGVTPTPEVTLIPTLFGGGRGEIAFLSNRNSTYQQVYLANADGSNVRQVTDVLGPGRVVPELSWSPDGTKIALHSAWRAVDDGVDHVYVLDVESGALSRLTNNIFAEEDPKWSPDGSEILFISGGNASQPYDLYTVNSDGTNQRLIAEDAVSAASWSADGTQIVYTANGEVFVMDANGGNRQQLTRNSVWEWHPSWSPDGSRIVFVSRRDDNSEIYTMNPDGTDQRRLTTTPEDEAHPAWSPDGSRIVFVSRRDDNSEIYTMNPDGTDQRRLTTTPEDEAHPAWSPDGQHITYDYNGDIYIMDADGTNQRLLITSDRFNGYAVWRPG